MSLLDELDDIAASFYEEDEKFGCYDRGEMYLRVYMTTGGHSAVVEGSISTFSGFVGGAAFWAHDNLIRKAA